MPSATPLDRLADLGLELPARFAPVGAYVPVVREGGFAFTSGAGPVRQDGSVVTGKVGADLDLDEAVEAARLTGLQILANLDAELGGLDRVRRVVKILGMVNVAPGFTQIPQVIDGCSELLVAELPMGIAVEIEAVVAC